jgi:hypothetical protein
VNFALAPGVINCDRCEILAKLVRLKVQGEFGQQNFGRTGISFVRRNQQKNKVPSSKKKSTKKRNSILKN